MKFATLGSVIAGDIIAKAAQKKLDWHNVCSYISFNPIAMVDSLSNDDLPLDIFFDEPVANREKLSDDLNGNIFNRLLTVKFDYLLVDLSDMRMPERVIEMANGKRIYFTKKSIANSTEEKLKHTLINYYNCDIKSDTLRGLSNFSDSELETYISKFLSLLSSICGLEKIIIIKPKLATQYLDKNTIKHTPNFTISGNTNKTIDRIYSLLPKNYSYIDAPKNIIGDIDCLSPFEYHFCQPYYDYVISCIEKIIGGGVYMPDYPLDLCESNIHKLYFNVFCQQCLTKMEAFKDRDIVLISPQIGRQQFENLFKQKYGKELFAFIEYEVETPIEAIEKSLIGLKSCGRDIYFVIPEIHNKSELFKLLYRLDYVMGMDSCSYFQTVQLKDFSGYYEDIFNNRVSAKTKCTLVLEGAVSVTIGNSGLLKPIIIMKQAAELVIGNNSKFIRGEITCSVCSKVCIGDNCSFGGGSIVATFFSQIHIGDDCLFSWNEFIYSGEGHAIFQIENAKNKIAKRIRHCDDASLKIGSHVWMAYGGSVLSGAEIGDGCIIATGSLVNKRFPNNCLIMGSPAKIGKRNIVWSANYILNEIERDKLSYNKYLNETED